MTTAARLLQSFYSGFGVPAYHEMTVPDDAQYPYITYSLAGSQFGAHATHYCQVFDHSNSNALILSVADKILQAIGQGVMLKHDGGCICIRPDTTPVQVLVDEADLPETPVRRAYIALQLDTYNMPGT